MSTFGVQLGSPGKAEKAFAALDISMILTTPSAFTSPSIDTIMGPQVSARAKEKYGQFAPMIGKNALLQLLKDAIRKDFFDKSFLTDLTKSIQTKLEK